MERERRLVVREKKSTKGRLVMRERRVCGEEEGGMVVAATALGFIWRRWQAHPNGGPKPLPRAI